MASLILDLSHGQLEFDLNQYLALQPLLFNNDLLFLVNNEYEMDCEKPVWF
jgi:hypothetical protein